MRFALKVFNRLVPLAAICAFFSLSALFSAHHLVFDLISHFRVQYIVLLLPVFLLSIYTKKMLSALVICVAMGVHGYAVAMSLLAVPVDRHSDYQEIKVLTSNLLWINTNYQAQLDIIAAVNPDIVALQEYTQAWHDVLSNSLPLYPHKVTFPMHGAFGIALYSKHPIVAGGLDNFTEDTLPVINTDIDFGNGVVRVMAVHPPAPSNQGMYILRNEILQRIGLEAKAQDGAVIVIGDFNSTPWTSHFSSMTNIGGLRNARAGHGLHPTWPADVFALRIPIDHILVNSRVGVRHFEAVLLEGSDHLNVVGHLRIY